MCNSFILKEINLLNFRNHKNLYINNFENVNIFIGPNACGKTNILEAISLIFTGNSFRTVRNTDLVYLEEKLAKIDAKIKEGFGTKDNSLASYQDLSIIFKDNKKKYTLNSKAKSINEIKGRYPILDFVPDDLFLIKGSNLERRKALDKLGCQISSEYELVNSNFKRILLQKNKALKEDYDLNVFKTLNEIFILHSTQLLFYRLNLVKKIEEKLDLLYKKISCTNEKVSINYYTSWDNKHWLDKNTTRDEIKKVIFEKINKNQNKEALIRYCLYGPHRDKIEFLINGYNATRYASQGQQRTLVLSYKIAEMEIIKEQLNKQPILLLDDVMSELDKNRRKSLLYYTKKFSQVFITATNLLYFDKYFLDNSKIFNM